MKAMISVASIIRNSAAGLGERHFEHMEDIMPMIYSVEVKIKGSREKVKSFQYVLGPGAGKGPAQKLVLNYLTRTYPSVNVKDIHIDLKEAGRLLVK